MAGSRPWLRAALRRLDPVRRRVSRWTVARAVGAGAGTRVEALPARGIFRILVCKVSHTLGNTLMLTPLLQELEARYPGAEVDIVTRNGVARSLFEGYANVGRVHRLPAHGLRHPWRVVRTLRDLRAAAYDLAIDADPRSQTGRLLVNLVGARYSIGFIGPGQQGHASIGVPMPPPRSVGQSALPVYLLRRACGDAREADVPAPALRLSVAERAAGARQLARVLEPGRAGGRGRVPSGAPVVGIFANATGAKRLPGPWWDRFLSAFEHACPGVVLVEIVPMFGRSLLDHRYPAYFSSDVRRLAAVLSALAVHVSADCGVMHLANAAGPRTVGFFDGTPPADWGVAGPGHANVYFAGRSPEQVAAEVAALVGGPHEPLMPARAVLAGAE